MASYCVLNTESGEYLCKFNVFKREKGMAVTFPTFKKAQKEARRMNDNMTAFYRMNDHDFPFMRGKSCTKYQPVAV